MKEVLADIAQKLQQNAYQNEEHVRLSLVARLLFALGWDIWDPNRVNAEFKPIPAEDGTKVDLALFVEYRIPSVFIEIKGVGKITDLGEAERQLRDYNRNNTAKFTVLTDGRTWRFYFSQTAGEFRDKCFKIIDLKQDVLEEAESAMRMFLSMESVTSGRAEQEANDLLNLTRTQRTMKEVLPEARRRTAEMPFPALPDALVSVMKERGFTVSREEALKFLGAIRPAPQEVEQIKLTVTKRGGDGDEGIEPPDPDVVNLNPDHPESLTFTRVYQATLGNRPASNWGALVYEGLKAAKEAGYSISDVRKATQGQVEEGARTTDGFRPIPGTGWSVRGMDANRTWNCALNLAKLMRCHIEAKFQWQNKDGAAHPGKEGFIRWLP